MRTDVRAKLSGKPDRRGMAADQRETGHSLRVAAQRQHSPQGRGFLSQSVWCDRICQPPWNGQPSGRATLGGQPFRGLEHILMVLHLITGHRIAGWHRLPHWEPLHTMWEGLPCRDRIEMSTYPVKCHQYALEPSEQLPIQDLPAGGPKLPPAATSGRSGSTRWLETRLTTTRRPPKRVLPANRDGVISAESGQLQQVPAMGTVSGGTNNAMWE